MKRPPRAPAPRVVRRGNEIVNLTRTEWNLLQCLASNADKLMMNAELLGKVWGPEYVSDLQYLRVWISRLRTKIGHNSSGHSIVRTFPGIGYMLSTQPEVAAGEEAVEFGGGFRVERPLVRFAAAVGGEEPVGDIDGDALLALGLKAVDQQGEVDLLALGAVAFRVGLERLELVVEDALRLIKKPADEGALAVVDAAAGDEPQGLLVALLLEVLDDVARVQFRHQKYPSCFFFSIEPGWSLSISRPWRSELTVLKVSAMISSMVVASLSMAAVRG